MSCERCETERQCIMCPVVTPRESCVMCQTGACYTHPTRTREGFEAAALDLLRAKRFVHGTALLDLAIEHGCGVCSDSHVERFLRAHCTPNHPAPTHSQLAFASLGNSASRNWSVCGPGTELAWYWTLKPEYYEPERVDYVCVDIV